MNNKNLRNVLSKFATGVTIVSTIDDDGKPVGMTVNSFTSVSLDPPLVLWNIGINQPSYDIFLNAKGYSVSILSKDQRDVCNLFSSSVDNKFNNVDFKYDLNNENLNILNKININISGGKMTALVGHSGSGKSTILNLIPRFYNATAGEIKIAKNLTMFS